MYDPRHVRLPIVGVGASAGGLRALQRFFGSLPDDTGMAFVVIVHLDPHHESQMAELLQASTAMPVRQLAESLSAEPDHVYIIPPGKDLTIVDGELQASPRSETERGRAPIDRFFHTLAETHDSDAVGVILSGTGSDGSQGIRWIKERGGITLAQSPDDAEYDGMPRSAIETGHVDMVLPAAELALELTRLRRAGSSIALPAEDGALGAPETTALGEILDHLCAKTGRDFTGYKHGTVVRRLERRMQFAGTENLAEYVRVLRDDPAETSKLFNDLLIGVTSFFRDPDAFDALDREAVPALFADRGPEDDVRVWVAGCATGEEAYSLAILLTEYTDGLPAPPNVKIFATDVHERSFTFAREGLYPESIEADVSPARLARFFTREEPGGYRVKQSVREKVLFATHDLLKDPPFLRLDLASCRNVLIYLQREPQQRLLELFHFALRPRGYLFLGGSESTDAASRLFTAVDRKWHIYRSVDGPHPLAFRPAKLTAGESHASTTAADSRRRSLFSFGALHQQLVEVYAPPSLVVNAYDEVVHISNQAGRYLRHSGGVPTNKLLDMVEGELRVKLRTLLRKARRTGTPAEAEKVRFEIDGKHRRLDLGVRPLPAADAADSAGRFLLVLFDERPGTRTAPAGVAADGAESDRAASLEQLEQELKDTKAQLAVMSEEHETTIGELRASNEELQSITEEQRAVAEELEASKEELQSMNEELRTINQEHRIRNEELAQVNADLINLIDSTDIGTLFLDRQLCIRRYTPPVAQVFNFVATDVGRPLSDVTHRLDYADLEDDVRAVLKKLTRIEREITSRDGRWFVVRLSPYRSADDRIDGVVLTLIDNTARKHAELEREALLERAEQASRAKSNFIGAMSHEFRTPLNAILGYSELLREGAVGSVTPDQREHLGRISANVRHLERMVEDILASARREVVEVVVECKPVDLPALVREVADSVESLATVRGLALTVDAPERRTIIETDGAKLHQILFNLLGNAIRYTDHGHVQLRARVDEETIVLEVEDTGIGIAPEHLERIFERFWQVDQGRTRVRGGTGLGLMVSRDLARALGGDIEVTSEFGRGSLFRVRLPREPARPDR